MHSPITHILRARGIWILPIVALICQSAHADDLDQPFRAQILTTHCADCHLGDSAEAGFDVEQLSFDLHDRTTKQRWERVFERVESGEMPPADYGELLSGERQEFLSATYRWLQQHDQQEDDRAGRVRGRRLTRAQVERSLQDLLGIDVPLVQHLPEENRAAGFTTVADSQTMSHFQLRAHLLAVDAALDEAFRRALSEEDEYQRDLDARGVARENPRSRCREPEMRNGLAVVWNSGVTYHGRLPATTAPADGWYRFEVTLEAVRPPAGQGVWGTVRSGRCISSAPLLENVAQFEATEQPRTIELVTWLPQGHMLEIRPGDAALKVGRFRGGQIGTGEGESQNIAGIGIHRVTMQRIHLNGDDDQVRRLLFGEVVVRKGRKGSFEVRAEHPEEDLARLMTQFAARAFRRPVEQQEIAPYILAASESFRQNEDFVEALRMGYRSLLCSPRFLYFHEIPGPLDDHAIATRLSYFLTGSTPDEQLRELAQAGNLTEESVLRDQTRRLLAGKQGRKFLVDFSSQWLELDQIDFTTPDRRMFGDFDTIVQESMLDETIEYLETMLRDNLSITHLIDSDFTYLNSRLARYYGIEGVQGDTLRRVSLDADSPRGGLLTQGAIMKITANGTNTSPVIRGVWVSERLLGREIPAPPSNVPAVEPDIRGATTIREQLAKHRSDSQCSSCHAKIDPPGFALENFDPTGRWRETYPSKSKQRLEIDASYELADGRSFQDIRGFQKIACSQPRELAAGFVRQLLVYGTGAEIRLSDRKEIDRIVEAASSEHFGMHSLIEETVLSPLFLRK